MKNLVQESTLERYIVRFRVRSHGPSMRYETSAERVETVEVDAPNPAFAKEQARKNLELRLNPRDWIMSCLSCYKKTAKLFRFRASFSIHHYDEFEEDQGYYDCSIEVMAENPEQAKDIAREEILINRSPNDATSSCSIEQIDSELDRKEEEDEV